MVDEWINLESCICNQLRGNLCDVLPFQKVGWALRLQPWVEPSVDFISLGSSLVVEDLKCNLAER